MRCRVDARASSCCRPPVHTRLQYVEMSTGPGRRLRDRRGKSLYAEHEAPVRRPTCTYRASQQASASHVVNRPRPCFTRPSSELSAFSTSRDSDAMVQRGRTLVSVYSMRGEDRDRAVAHRYQVNLFEVRTESSKQRLVLQGLATAARAQFLLCFQLARWRSAIAGLVTAVPYQRFDAQTAASGGRRREKSELFCATRLPREFLCSKPWPKALPKKRGPFRFRAWASSLQLEWAA